MKKKRHYIYLWLFIIVYILTPFTYATNTETSLLSPDEQADVYLLEDFLTLAEQYQDADITQTGITASINQDGRLQIMKELPTPTGLRQANSTEKQYALSTLLAVDSSGEEITGRTISEVLENTGSSQDVYAIHTTYIAYRLKPGDGGSTGQIRVDSMETYFIYGSALTASYFYHRYIPNIISPDYQVDYDRIYFPDEDVIYSQNVTSSSWHTLGGLDAIIGSSVIVAVGSSTFEVANSVNCETPWPL